MFCSKCGQEISDDSKYCYSCGSKVEIKEKQDTVTDTPLPIVNIKTPPELQNTTQETIDQTISSPSSKTDSDELLLKKRKWNYGLLI